MSASTGCVLVGKRNSRWTTVRSGKVRWTPEWDTGGRWDDREWAWTLETSVGLKLGAGWVTTREEVGSSGQRVSTRYARLCRLMNRSSWMFLQFECSEDVGGRFVGKEKVVVRHRVVRSWESFEEATEQSCEEWKRFMLVFAGGAEDVRIRRQIELRLA